jgi:hypothetical protein
MAKGNDPGFMDFGWTTWGVIIVGIILVALFMGPGMWSSSTEFLGTTFWRWLRTRKQPPPKTPPST